jgi:hypothetical protein
MIRIVPNKRIRKRQVVNERENCCNPNPDFACYRPDVSKQGTGRGSALFMVSAHIVGGADCHNTPDRFRYRVYRRQHEIAQKSGCLKHRISPAIIFETDLKPRTNRPRIDIPLSAFEHALNLAAALGILFDALVLWRFWPVLPARLPAHYDFAGRPDAWGGKDTLLILPAVSLFFFVMFLILERFPRIYNYPVIITQANAARQYRLARGLLAWLDFAIIWFFTYIEWRTILIAAGQAGGLGAAAILVFLFMIIGSIVVYMIQAFKAR